MLDCPECATEGSVGLVGVNWNGEEYTDYGVQCEECGWSDY